MSTMRCPSTSSPTPPERLIDVSELLDAYVDLRPDPAVAAQRVVFGTSGHRGIAVERSFNEWHVLAISQAICDYRDRQNIDGPLFLGIDTHALSAPARDSVLVVLAANDVDVMLAGESEYTPTPSISLAILDYNRGRTSGLADGIVLTPSHNPPAYGGFKYNPPHGGPAGQTVTDRIQDAANRYLESGLNGVKRMPLRTARGEGTVHRYDYLTAYVEDLRHVIDMPAIRTAGLRLGVDPLGGAGVHYWARIADTYALDLDIVNTQVDPTFAFMPVDWDGAIRMDPSSSRAMQRLIDLKTRYDVAFACDTDHDRHGIVTHAGLMPSNHYLCVLADYLFRHRIQWAADAAVGKTVVSTALIDRVVERLGRKLYEVPAGFKWFVGGLLDARLAFGGEESAGATFSRFDGRVWTTDKDGIVAALASAEIGARSGRDPSEYYDELVQELGGGSFAERIEAPANAQQKHRLANLSPRQMTGTELAGDAIENVIDRAPGNSARIGGIKVTTAHGWFAARPSGTEDLYKIYAESFRDAAHLKRILTEAQIIVNAALADDSKGSS
ncbi:MAG: phosphoglucomutase (alpha-D-glucose-1,6-bisphosphate-dependent) [Salinisphaera sp.]|jgi:phosphoglucomutase|nr:phosphoglucomutase (alpha-D-glucose-1,6-bisphosphate-dependent) [Salinisphaera sp.]